MTAPTAVPHQETAADRSAPRTGPVLDLTVPVFDEEVDLRPCVERLHAYLRQTFPYPFRITIADNASTDGTWAVAQGLADRFPEVVATHLDARGRGRALRASWAASDADVLAYMDVDLSTDLSALLPLVAPLVSGHSDVAIGSRLTSGSRVVRGAKREVISRCYNLLLRGTLGAKFSDAQCGFKAVRADVARRLLPLVQDEGWFFDTELLVLAERSGLRIHEVAVDWVDDPDSRVDVVATAKADLRGIARLARAFATGALPLSAVRAQLGRAPLAEATRPGLLGQLVRFGVIGGFSTLAYVVLYVLLSPVTGAQAANFLALLITAVANTAANRRLTFGVRGSEGATKHQVQGLLVFGIGLALTSGSLAALHTSGSTSRLLEVVVLVGANLLATVIRFLLLRVWVFRSRADRADDPALGGSPASPAPPTASTSPAETRP